MLACACRLQCVWDDLCIGQSEYWATQSGKNNDLLSSTVFRLHQRNLKELVRKWHRRSQSPSLLSSDGSWTLILLLSLSEDVPLWLQHVSMEGCWRMLENAEIVPAAKRLMSEYFSCKASQCVGKMSRTKKQRRTAQPVLWEDFKPTSQIQNKCTMVAMPLRLAC